MADGGNFGGFRLFGGRWSGAVVHLGEQVDIPVSVYVDCSLVVDFYVIEVGKYCDYE